jgi:predicted aldo/keto reductase-like oxidoreductase
MNMEYRHLGKTGINVSRLCFGSLTLSPLQANLSVDAGADLIRYAMDKGVNFLDTAELYDNYRYINRALDGRPRDRLVIATKCYAYTAEMAEDSLKKALKEINTDYIDIFMLHEQESQYTLKGHREAIEYFLKAKAKGYIRAFGISTHNIAGVWAAAEWEQIDVIHPIVNITGLGIVDGRIDRMLEAVRCASERGKGIYAMKPLGGGNLIPRFYECFDFVLRISFIDSVAVGMQCTQEIDTNIAIFEGREVPVGLVQELSAKSRRLHISFWCEGCGECAKACQQRAMSVDGGKACVDTQRCTLCGYCASKCKNFCIKVI